MPDNGPWITKTIIDLEEQVAELETMVLVFRGCIDTQVFPAKGSPCHDQIHALVGKNTEKGT
jgi:tetrahydromethanopterin S-methyltransferase subunit B